MHESFMRVALEQAENALSSGNIPIGACVVIDNKIVGVGYNQVDNKKDDTLHAEMIAIKMASKALFGRSAIKPNSIASIYSTLEPCAMCTGAIINAGIQQIVYGVEDSLVGATKCIFSHPYYRKKLVNMVPNVLANDAQELLNRYVNLHKCRYHLSNQPVNS